MRWNGRTIPTPLPGDGWWVVEQAERGQAAHGRW